MRILPRWDEALLLSIVRNLSVYKGSGGSKPHKALLLILILERFKKSQLSIVKYRDVASDLTQSIKTFSDGRQAHADYPFWYLQNDHLLEVFYEPPLRFRKDKDFAPHQALLKANAVGKLPLWIEKLLRKKPELVEKIQKLVAQEYVGRPLDDVLRSFRR
jgi:predicted restriction endonuclease